MLLGNSKQNIKSLSLLVGTTVCDLLSLYSHAIWIFDKNQIKEQIIQIRGAFIIYCNCHRNSNAMHAIPMKYNTGNSSIFYLSMNASIVPIGALVFVLHALEMMSFI